MNTNFSQQAEKNASIIKSEIDNLSSGHRDFFKRDYKSFWAHTKLISQLFKELKPLNRTDREELWFKFSSLCDETRNKQQAEWKEHEKQTEKNASTIKGEIDNLSLGHWDFFKRDYKSFWAHTKRILQLFKELKPLKKTDREELWLKFSSICDETRNKQQSEWKERERKSKSHRDYILSEISSAEVNTLFGFDPPDIQEMKSLSQVLKKADIMLSDHKDEMLGEHKQECFKRIQEVRRSHDAWWAELKHYKNEVKNHKKKKHEEFQIRIRANLERNLERHRNASEALERYRRRADELSNKIASSWNDNWVSNATGWLSELEDKISDIERSISQIEDWIREDEEKLR